MLTSSRMAWFAITFAFAVPSMLVMFRDDSGLTRRTWIQSLIFAASIAAIIAICCGKGKP
ncbi:hypothetical protein ACFV98_30210 [Streptomyces violascens]|uniref:hypothetical protein n=1 Tax=Streptomyces violascens TaxID=67381 RepID=UPI00364E8693